MALRFDVVCVGAVNLDTIVEVERAPQEDERVTADRFITAGGGPAATTAVALARLGVRVAFCGVVGDDPEGRLSVELLEQEGVSTRWLRVDAGANTARAVVIVSRATGSRSILTTVASRPRPDDVPIGESEWIHVDQTGYQATVDARLAQSSLTRLSVDGGNEIPELRLGDVALYAPTLSALRRRYADADADSAIRRALTDGAQRVVVTDGARGGLLAEAGGRPQQFGSYPVEVVSTLGAGDVFHGALIAGLLDGRSLTGAADFAAAAAGLSCRGVDGRSSAPRRTELDRFLSGTSSTGASGGPRRDGSAGGERRVTVCGPNFRGDNY